MMSKMKEIMMRCFSRDKVDFGMITRHHALDKWNADTCIGYAANLCSAGTIQNGLFSNLIWRLWSTLRRLLREYKELSDNGNISSFPSTNQSMQRRDHVNT